LAMTVGHFSLKQPKDYIGYNLISLYGQAVLSFTFSRPEKALL